MKAVYTLSDWIESTEEEILVTRVRAMELFGTDKKYYIKD